MSGRQSTTFFLKIADVNHVNLKKKSPDFGVETAVRVEIQYYLHKNMDQISTLNPFRFFVTRCLSSELGALNALNPVGKEEMFVKKESQGPTEKLAPITCNKEKSFAHRGNRSWNKLMFITVYLCIGRTY